MKIAAMEPFPETTMIWLLTFPLWAPLLMLALYAIGIQYERGGWWSVCVVVAMIGYVFDIFLQYTLVQVYFWEIAPPNEATISARLARLVERSDWRGALASAFPFQWRMRKQWFCNESVAASMGMNSPEIFGPSQFASILASIGKDVTEQFFREKP